jgi:hypothetical protein
LFFTLFLVPLHRKKTEQLMTQGKVIHFVCCAILICGMMAGCKSQKSGNHNDTSMMEEFQTPAPSYEGVYLDEDNNEPNLYITLRDDGKYDVKIGIFRLTNLDDGIGTMGANGMEFTATDAAGNPIGGEIILRGDTAEVIFTRSTWSLLENGSKFRYHRQK